MADENAKDFCFFPKGTLEKVIPKPYFDFKKKTQTILIIFFFA